MTIHAEEGGEFLARREAPMPRQTTPLVPKNSISGHALVAVIAIMTFLVSLTTGTVMLVWAAATEWQSDVGREMTIQVRPEPSRDIEAEVRATVEAVRSFPGIIEVVPYSKEQSAQLLEPWLGSGLSLDDLPVPRMIVVRVAPGARLDLPALRKLVSERAAGASLDDHRAWIDRMRAMAGTAAAGGLAVLGLMFAVTIMSVAFATRSAMATNRGIVEVLHFVGAKDGFIAGLFLRHFLMLGLEGGAIGGSAAILLFALLDLAGAWFSGTAAIDQILALFGTLSIGPAGFMAILGQIALIAAVTGVTSGHTVKRTLETI